MPWRRLREWRYSSTILDHGTCWRWVVSFTPRPLYRRVRTPGTNWIGDWVGPVWTLWRREKCFAPAGNRTPEVQPVATPTDAHEVGSDSRINERQCIPETNSYYTWNLVSKTTREFRHMKRCKYSGLKQIFKDGLKNMIQGIFQNVLI
jgi:hypothetical protein